MLYLVWIPEDPSVVAALVPSEPQPEARRSVFMNQYIVDSAEQNGARVNAAPGYGTPHGARARRDLRARKIRQKLGAVPMMSAFPPRPRYMRRKTYDHIYPIK
jgi:hypothetical protein